MSFSKNDQVFPPDFFINIERRIAQAVAKALRQDYEELPSAVKWIGRKTGAHPRAIRNWYEARNAPNSAHLVMLARSSAHVLRVLLELIERVDLAEYCERDFSDPSLRVLPLHRKSSPKFYGEKSFTIKVAVKPSVAILLNQRQLWFLGMLQEGADIRTGDIASIWGVTNRSAKADIAHLKKLGLVRFVGAKKNGHYRAATLASSPPF